MVHTGFILPTVYEREVMKALDSINPKIFSNAPTQRSTSSVAGVKSGESICHAQWYPFLTLLSLSTFVV
jgi:hypothetical protein